MVEFVEETTGERRYSYHLSLQIKEETKLGRVEVFVNL